MPRIMFDESILESLLPGNMTSGDALNNFLQICLFKKEGKELLLFYL